MSQEFKTGQKVELKLLRETDLGWVAQINGKDEGLLYHSEIFEKLSPDQEVPGYIKKVREDGGIDLILQPFGNLGSEQLAEQILSTVKENNGFLPINDHSPADEIYDHFGVSKKKFKMALGNLYKKRLIIITEKGIEMIQRRKNVT